MAYRVVMATDRKLLGKKFFYDEIEKEEVSELLLIEFEGDSTEVEGPYIKIRNSNYTIILKEI